MQDFRKLAVWKRSHELTLLVYKASGSFPRDELFGLTSQFKRAASSIPANIAEGCGRDTNADFARFLQIAFGSASELEYHLLLARDLGFLPVPDYGQLESEVTAIKRMLTGLLQKIRTYPRRTSDSDGTDYGLLPSEATDY